MGENPLQILIHPLQGKLLCSPPVRCYWPPLAPASFSPVVCLAPLLPSVQMLVAMETARVYYLWLCCPWRRCLYSLAFGFDLLQLTLFLWCPSRQRHFSALIWLCASWTGICGTLRKISCYVLGPTMRSWIDLPMLTNDPHKRDIILILPTKEQMQWHWVFSQLCSN